MVNLEHFKQLEAKVSKAIDYIKRLTKEKADLLQREEELETKLESYQKRIDELEDLAARFKEDQGRIEESILSALDKLSQFEEAMEKSLKEKPHSHAPAPRAKEPTAKPQQAVQGSLAKAAEEALSAAENASVNEKICFEIPESETGDDIPDPLEETLDDETLNEGGQAADGEELDIF